jgi:hypothetical protein
MLRECFSRFQVAVRPQTRLLPGRPPKKSIFVPYLHFSAHGNDQGLGLTSGEFVSWAELRELLVNFARSTGYLGEKGIALLSVTFSVCEGATASRMFRGPLPQPCVAVVGPTHSVSWPDSLVAFITFFHQMIVKDKSAQEAVMIMNQAAGFTDVFQCIRYSDVNCA